MRKYVNTYSKYNNYILFTDSIKYNNLYNYETEKLFCGGAFGHIRHPFEDMKLSFDDLKAMIKMLMEEGSSTDSIITEKTDGIQLSFSWKKGQLICARNKQHLKNFGENALNSIALQDIFKDRGEIENAFILAINDLEQAIKKMPPKDRQNFFQEGKKFMSVEIIYNKSENSIPYNIDLLVFHGLIEYDKNGNPIEMDKKAGITIAKILKDINANIGKTFRIDGPNPVEIIKSSDFSDKAKKYMAQISELQKEFLLKDDNTIADYHYEWFKNYIKTKAKFFKYNISDDLLDKIAKRFGFQDKTLFKATEFKKIDNKEFADWLIEFNKKDYDEVYKKNMEKFEMIFFKVGVDILKTLSNYLVFNKDQSKQQMKKKLELAIDTIQKSANTEKINIMLDNLKKIDEMGGIDELIPTEGIVFFYKGKLYKITGIFTSYHRIVSMLKFSK